VSIRSLPCMSFALLLGLFAGPVHALGATHDLVQVGPLTGDLLGGVGLVHCNLPQATKRQSRSREFESNFVMNQPRDEALTMAGETDAFGQTCSIG
jgi:hypothetical protein